MCIHDVDSFYALLGSERGKSVVFLEETYSTNDVLRQMAQADAPGGTAVFALKQTGGRGRRGHTFSSEEGGVYLSYLFRMDECAEETLILTPMVAAAAAERMETLCNERISIKWVNDLFLNGKKLGGILTETRMNQDIPKLEYAVVGIGINVNTASFPDELEGRATSLFLENGKAYSVYSFAAELIKALDELSSDWDAERWRTIYRDRCLTLGQTVLFREKTGMTVGMAEDIDSRFGLIVRRSDNSLTTIHAGEVCILHPLCEENEKLNEL